MESEPRNEIGKEKTSWLHMERGDGVSCTKLSKNMCVRYVLQCIYDMSETDFHEIGYLNPRSAITMYVTITRSPPRSMFAPSTPIVSLNSHVPEVFSYPHLGIHFLPPQATALSSALSYKIHSLSYVTSLPPHSLFPFCLPSPLLPPLHPGPPGGHINLFQLYSHS